MSRVLLRWVIPKTVDAQRAKTTAAVIGENPGLFGFDFDDPLVNLEDRHAGANGSIKDK